MPPGRLPGSSFEASPSAIPGSSPTTASISPSMPGEIHAVLGENGAGKSTLMKIIYGVVQADAGAIRWEGQRRRASPTRRRRAQLGIGMVFQHFSLFETLTVVENIALGARRGRSTWRAARDADSRSVAQLRPAARSAPAACTRCRSASGSASRSSAACCRTRAADHGRADLGADAAGGRQALRHAAAARRRRLQHPLHQPQARRDPRAVPQRDRAARRQGHRRRAIPRSETRRRSRA